MEDRRTFIRLQAIPRTKFNSRLRSSFNPVVGLSNQQYFLCHVGLDDLYLREHAKLLVEKVAVSEKGWPVGHYIDRYCDRSQLFVVMYGETVVGVVLIVEGDCLSFPIRSADSWPNLSVPDGTSAEIPFVVVDKKYRGSSGVSYMLCAACHWYFYKSSIDYMELTLDQNLLNFYLWHGMAMEEISESDGGGRKYHWGEGDIFPARLYVGNPNDLGSMGYGIKKKCPEMWEIFLHFEMS